MINPKKTNFNDTTNLYINDIHNKYPDIHNHLVLKPGCIGEYKIEWDTYVYTVNKKLVAILSQNDKIGFDILTLKLNVENNLQTRDMYPNIIIPGYHMNKMHWSSILLNTNEKLPNEVLKELMDESYSLVFSSLSKKIQQSIINNGVSK